MKRFSLMANSEVSCGLLSHPWLLAVLRRHCNLCGPENSNRFSLTNGDLVCENCNIVVANWERDKKSNLTVGVLGFGSFGQFLTKHLVTAFHKVVAADLASKSKEAMDLGAAWTTIEEAAQQDVVILAVPVARFARLVNHISQLFKPDSLVVDVCSVKMKTMRDMLEFLPEDVDFVGTHPLFGPQSAKSGLLGHKIVLCPGRIGQDRLGVFKSLLTNGYGLQVVELDVEDHDREMARVQGLTHFIARALQGCNIIESSLATEAFQKLTESMKLLSTDSWDLFATIENGNPFAAGLRRQFIQELEKLDTRLKE